MKIFKRLLDPGAFFLLSVAFLWRVTLAGEALIPAGMLRYLAPWVSDADKRPAWNPLMYDSVGQFLPWRRFLSDSLRHGVIPLWNPFVFCGTPFLANSQSAPLYPINWLYLVIPDTVAAGWIAVIHLTLAGWFTQLFLKRIGLTQIPAFFGGIAFAFSTWQVAWLQLPTFLNTSCWLPLCLLLTLNLLQKPRVRSVASLGAALGMALLAGHLQIAFYLFFAVVIFGIVLVIRGEKNPIFGGACLPKSLFILLPALILAGMIASPQVLPALELSRASHRVSKPSEEGYGAYTAYSVGAETLVTAFLPDFFGNPSSSDNPYFGESKGGVPFNYAEGALYVGVATLFLAALGLSRLKRDRSVVFLGALGLVALLMALGTAFDRPFYFFVPGFGQSGSPGRALVLVAFALSSLAALGLQNLISTDPSKLQRVQSVGFVLGFGALIAALAFATLKPAYANDLHLVPMLIKFVVTAIVVISLILRPIKLESSRKWVGLTAISILVIDLFCQGLGYPQTSPKAEVYPETELTGYLRTTVGHDRVMPVNIRNFSFKGPTSVLPPNTLMAYGIRDIQGYDSLFPGQYKAFMNELAAKVAPDASPLEVGNMVFAKDPLSPLVDLAGVRVIVLQVPIQITSPESTMKDGVYVYPLPGAGGRARLEDPVGGNVRWVVDDANHVEIETDSAKGNKLILADEIYPGWHALVDGTETPIVRVNKVFRSVDLTSGKHVVSMDFRPLSFQAGLFFMLFAASVVAGAFTLHCRTRGRGDAISAI